MQDKLDVIWGNEPLPLTDDEAGTLTSPPRLG
jgi:hypothetical protein